MIKIEKRKSEPKKHLATNVFESDYDLVKDIARYYGRTVSEYLRELVLKQIEAEQKNIQKAVDSQ